MVKSVLKNKIKSPFILSGFTLLELIVVMAIVALLTSVAAPAYFKSISKARDNSLSTTLRVVRDAIEQFASDKGKYPESLDNLISERYLRSIPVDPVTGRYDTWVLIPADKDAPLKGNMYDLRSGAAGVDHAGVLYGDK